MKIVIAAKRPKISRVVDPFLINAVEEANKLLNKSELSVQNNITVVSIGACRSRVQLKQALALGVQKGIQITTQDSLNAYTVSELLMDLIKHEQPDIVILTEELANAQNHTGQMLSYMLSNAALNAEHSKKRLLLIREVNSGAYSVAIPAYKQAAEALCQ